MRDMKPAGAAIVLATCGSLLTACQAEEPTPAPPPTYPIRDIKVLDGDTLIFEGRWIRVRGIDAPELRPWADCWAEAGLGRASFHALVEAIQSEDWSVVRADPADEHGMVVADLINEDGEDLAYDMVRYGYAAKTDGQWDWCGRNSYMGPPAQGDRSGPDIWWPRDHGFDERAND